MFDAVDCFISNKLKPSIIHIYITKSRYNDIVYFTVKKIMGAFRCCRWHKLVKHVNVSDYCLRLIYQYTFSKFFSCWNVTVYSLVMNFIYHSQLYNESKNDCVSYANRRHVYFVSIILYRFVFRQWDVLRKNSTLFFTLKIVMYRKSISMVLLMIWHKG